MNFPKTFPLPGVNFNVVFPAIKWYKAVPENIAQRCGNAFHENMFEIVMAEIEPFTDTLPTEYFVQGWEIVEGKLFVIIGDDDTGLEVARVELVCG